jgi:membrane protein implicated in regulation of membrane protease activity
LDASDWVWVWVGTALAFAVVELITPVLFWAISFTVGAGAAAAASLVGVSIGVQWGVFALGTAGSLAALVPIGLRIAHGESDDEPEGASRWVGRTAVVLEEIPAGAHATGLVRLERARWRAQTIDDTAVPVGAEVEVLSVRGTRLVVASVSPPHLESGT